MIDDVNIYSPCQKQYITDSFGSISQLIPVVDFGNIFHLLS